jgi:hypothetical protein
LLDLFHYYKAFNNYIGTSAIVNYVIIILQHSGISDLKYCVIMSE